MFNTDREALVKRNQALIDAFHAVPIKHKLRHRLLRFIAKLPIPKARTSMTTRLLVIRPDHLGDVLLTGPAVSALRSVHPSAEIHALVGAWSAEVMAHFDAIDRVLTLPFPGFDRAPKPSWRHPYELAWLTAQRLRRVGYAAAFVLRPDHWWGALVCYLAGIPQIIGHNTPDVAPFLTDAVPFVHNHAVTQNLRLVERFAKVALPVPKLEFTVDEIDRAWVAGFLDEWGLPPKRPIIAIHPGSGTAVKRWDDERWAFVADTLADQFDAAITFTGSDHELPLVRGILAHMRHPACVMVGETRVGTLAALYERARLVMGPDSGPLHLACAVGTPTVSLFGPADPIEFGPWVQPGLPHDKHAVVTASIGCRPCRILDWSGDDPVYHPCMREISAAQVIHAARLALNPG